MNLPKIVAREQWLDARKALLIREKELTRSYDAINAERRRLPMVPLEKDYVFEGPEGKVRLLDLFGDCRQLIIRHVMFWPERDRLCPSCSASLDELAPGLLRNLKARDTTFAAVSRAPYAKLAKERAGKGWTFDWFSSYENTFNYDFHVTLDSSVAPIQFNYRNPSELEEAGFGWVMTDEPTEHPGLSCFLRDGDEVFHTYSTYGRGTEQIGGVYAFLDMTALGRQEEWEKSRDR